MNAKTIIHPPSMPLALWVLVFTMALAVYMPSTYQIQPHSPSKTIELIAAHHPPGLHLQTKTAEIEPVQNFAPIAPIAVDSKPIIPVVSTKSEPPRSPEQSPLALVKKSERLYHPIILQAANRYQVDPAIVKAIIMAESSYNPKAVSKRGAKGLMQLMPKTAEEMGVEDIFNPEHNINGGVRYYKKLLKQFKGDIKLALAAYNAGMRTVKEHNGVPPYKSTRYYIKKVFEYYQHYKNQVETDKA
jgi:soluble lytic murein transglycosylase-like protein